MRGGSRQKPQVEAVWAAREEEALAYERQALRPHGLSHLPLSAVSVDRLAPRPIRMGLDRRQVSTLGAGAMPTRNASVCPLSLLILELLQGFPHAVQRFSENSAGAAEV